MEKNVKEKYLKALRSSKFRQAKDFLKLRSNFCALGLLCEIYRREVKRGKWVGPFIGKRGEKDAYCFKVNGEFSIELPSKTICDWASVSVEDCLTIYKMNDLEGLNFSQIADKIEEIF